MRKWHPNKLEIYTADLCLKKIGISRDIRTCIKKYLFDYKAVTDDFAKPCFASYYFGDVYAFFCTQRISFIQVPTSCFSSSVLEDLAIISLKAGLSVHYYISQSNANVYFNQIAKTCKTDNLICLTIGSYIHPKAPDVILCNLNYSYYSTKDIEHIINTSPNAIIVLLGIYKGSLMNETIKSIKI